MPMRDTGQLYARAPASPRSTAVVEVVDSTGDTVVVAPGAMENR